MFPMLMLVIMALHAITSATRTEQALQAVADRAAHAASLCCVNVDDAHDTARKTVGAHTGGRPGTSLDCANDVAEDATVTFADVRDRTVEPPDPVPGGGYVTVFLRCQLPAGAGGVFPGVATGVTRSAVGVASVDPYRHRHTPPPTEADPSAE